MRPSRVIPDPVRDFLLANIDSVTALETLLIMYAGPGEDWSAEEVAARTYVDVASARAVLESLLRTGFVVTSPAHRHYRLVLDRAQQSLLGEVADTYRTHLVQVATLIHSKPPSAVNEFARAFELKKDR